MLQMENAYLIIHFGSSLSATKQKANEIAWPRQDYDDLAKIRGSIGTFSPAAAAAGYAE